MFNNQSFEEKARLVHGDKYDYTNIQYKHNNQKIDIVCRTHGLFQQKPNIHLRGKGCPACGKMRQRDILSKTLQTFINQANFVHQNTFDYSLVQYVNAKTKINIVCSTHGIFKQSPERHLSGRGCPSCRGLKIAKSKSHTTSDFIQKAVIVHGDKYDYSKSQYVNAHSKILIICAIHGEFWQTPTNHIDNMCGCFACNQNCVSKAGTKWLDSLNVPVREFILPSTNYKVDGFNPTTNTVYEFLGCFWHGHPDFFNSNDIHPYSKISYGKLFEQTQERLNNIQGLGYHLVVKWDKEKPRI